MKKPALLKTSSKLGAPTPLNTTPLTLSLAGGTTRRLTIVHQALPRGLALFFGAFSLLNVLSRLRSTRFDQNLLWIDLRWLPSGVAEALLLVSAVCLLAFALRPAGSPWRRRLTLGGAAVLAL